MNYTCSLIIRSFNEEKHIGKLLEGVMKQTLYSETEVIVVDSGSTDMTLDIAEKKGAKILQVQPEEFSFGRALNKGCEAASGDYLLFASAHVYPVYSNWLEKMIAPFSNRKVALVYGRQIGNEVTKYSEHQIFKKWFPKISNYNQSTPFCNNANAAIKKEFWMKQPYDESLTGLEDLDWAIKIQNNGFIVAYEANAPIVHVHEETISRIKNRYKREAVALKKILPKQRISFLDFLRLTLANVISDGFHAIHDGVFVKNFIDILQFRSVQFWGTYQGFRQKGDVNDQLKRRFYYPNNLIRKPFLEPEPGEKIDYYEYEIQKS